MKLAVVITGTLSAAFMPFWANWLRSQRPDIDPVYLLSRSAHKFVSPASLSAIGGSEVQNDSWEDRDDPLHVELSDTIDALLIYPCSLHYLSRLARGQVDTPSLLTQACTDAPTVVAPGLPPGAIDNEPYRSHIAALEQRSDVHVVPPQPAPSARSERPASGAAPLHRVIDVLERKLASRRAE